MESQGCVEGRIHCWDELAPSNLIEPQSGPGNVSVAAGIKGPALRGLSDAIHEGRHGFARDAGFAIVRNSEPASRIEQRASDGAVDVFSSAAFASSNQLDAFKIHEAVEVPNGIAKGYAWIPASESCRTHVPFVQTRKDADAQRMSGSFRCPPGDCLQGVPGDEDITISRAW
jgi:hypothetical protein